MIARWSREVTLGEMLDARERRAAAQRAMRDEYGLTLVSFTLNMPGPVKDGTLPRMAFAAGLEQIEGALEAENIAVAARRETCGITGSEALLAVRAEAERVKALLCAVEETCEIGRYFDMDVLDERGEKIGRERVGAPPRRCFLCEKPAAACARSRAHSAGELASHVAAALDAFLDRRFADETAALAQQALLYEVAVTPKPGLVDRLNAGAHRDMDFFTFQRSAAVLVPYLRECALRGLRETGRPHAERFESLRCLGWQAERAMLRATGGVNTHKGAIFSLGLLCCARGAMRQTHASFTLDEWRAEAAALAAGTCRAFARAHGGALYGARREAADGFATVARVALPEMEKALRRGADANAAGVEALMRLLSQTEDTNLIRRGGKDAPARVRARTARALETAGALEAATALDKELTEQNLSPGGCADLLAIAFFFLFCRERDADVDAGFTFA